MPDRVSVTVSGGRCGHRLTGASDPWLVVVIVCGAQCMVAAHAPHLEAAALAAGSGSDAAPERQVL